MLLNIKAIKKIVIKCLSCINFIIFISLNIGYSYIHKILFLYKLYYYLYLIAFNVDIYINGFAYRSVCSYAITAHSIHVMTDGHIPFTLQS